MSSLEMKGWWKLNGGTRDRDRMSQEEGAGMEEELQIWKTTQSVQYPLLWKPWRQRTSQALCCLWIWHSQSRSTVRLHLYFLHWVAGACFLLVILLPCPSVYGGMNWFDGFFFLNKRIQSWVSRKGGTRKELVKTGWIWSSHGMEFLMN